MPKIEIIKMYWLEGTDGCDYTAHSFPAGVKWTGRKKPLGYVVKIDGQAFGTVYDSLVKAQVALDEWKDSIGGCNDV